MSASPLKPVDSAIAAAPTKNIETQAYVLEKAHDDFKLQDIVLDEVREDEVLIEWKFSGICHTVSPSSSPH